MLKKFYLLISIILILSLNLVPSYAQVADETMIDVIKAVGIMNGYSDGELHLDNYVTRAEFATMMVKASKYKDTLSGDGSSFSMFSDVKNSHWASEYVQIGVQQGWFAGYLDGTFKPDKTITLEEACTALLNMLGYDSSTLTGFFPQAQLNKASSVGLRDNIKTLPGRIITRMDCVKLFYNLLISEDVSGRIYGSNLGLDVKDNKINFNSIVLNDIEGPFVFNDDVSIDMNFNKIYRDNKEIDSLKINKYDVYYYNENVNTIWIYSDRAAGKISNLLPNNIDPSSVVLAGNTYEINSLDVKRVLSSIYGNKDDEVVTLLLGMHGDVVGIIKGEDVETTYYGIVEDSIVELLNDENAVLGRTLSVFCTDGVRRTFSIDSQITYKAGDLLSIQVLKGEVIVKRLSEKSLTGKINKSGTKFDDYTISDTVKIIDTTTEGIAVSIDVDKIAGKNLASRTNVRFYTLNEDKEIEHIILNDVSGEIWDYAYLTKVTDLSYEMHLNVIYNYVLDGNPLVLNSSGVAYAVKTGGIAIAYKADGTIKSMRSMESISIKELGLQKVKSSNNQFFELADKVQVYLRDGGKFYLTDLDSINVDDYRLTGWYDVFNAAGKEIRIIIAEEK